jgi:hypothetical protein
MREFSLARVASASPRAISRTFKPMRIDKRSKRLVTGSVTTEPTLWRTQHQLKLQNRPQSNHRLVDVTTARGLVP